MKYLLIVILCLFASGCEEVHANKITKTDSFGNTVVVAREIPIATQIVKTVPRDDLVTWIEASPTIIIDSVTPLTYGNGYLTGYLVVYRDTIKKVELSPREVALGKLTDADKALLGIK